MKCIGGIFGILSFLVSMNLFALSSNLKSLKEIVSAAEYIVIATVSDVRMVENLNASALDRNIYTKTANLGEVNYLKGDSETFNGNVTLSDGLILDDQTIRTNDIGRYIAVNRVEAIVKDSGVNSNSFSRASGGAHLHSGNRYIIFLNADFSPVDGAVGVFDISNGVVRTDTGRAVTQITRNAIVLDRYISQVGRESPLVASDGGRDTVVSYSVIDPVLEGLRPITSQSFIENIKTLLDN